MPTVKSTKKGASGPKRNPKQATPYNKAQKGSGLTSKPKSGRTGSISAPEKALNEAQSKYEALQDDMMSALEGISALGK
ncbi:hypothetical protein BGW38_001946 [Lunasporangiospora selenospora]|uniref:Uncharacterized protein n=1 Tax=Lunasporangiospora selenospora TaxID=979761 RepID=A0A9P6FUW6_9FUNG|nr:hypothetical protein BGW38_001946 [Lunasporangiospora selenospora]